MDHSLQSIVDRQHAYFRSMATRPVGYRIQKLKQLKKAIESHHEAICKALYMDLRKSEYEAFAAEIGQVVKEIQFAIRNLKDWARPKEVPTPIIFFPSTSHVHRDPLGTVLIISPWNYPFYLSISPLVSAIAGGNTAFIKPSEEAPHSAQLIEEIISSVFAEEYVKVVQGIGAEVIPSMLNAFRFDHVFFTGSTGVGQKIMEMASKKLVPVTLELGGKSPCIVDASASLDYTAKKIAWSKMMNAGQTCVAPDYVLVHSSIKDQLVEKITFQFNKMLGDDPRSSEDYGRIVNTKRFHALIGLLNNGRIVSGGRHDEQDLYIEPTLVEGVGMDHAVMQQEIFGPILPIITYETKEEVLEWIERNPFPLSLYVYAESKSVQQYYVERVRFGGCCINNGIIHLGNPHLPFGGVGPSGIGQYHGYYGFETFTRPKSILRSRSWFDAPLWYAPFKGKVAVLKKLFKYV
ncbi:MAG: aldehyde dehydrogenase [Chitinophagaceae bacterium]|jgi:aldehyde dehydrogenase (NAD+)